MKTEAEVNRAVERYTDMITRICLYRLKNPADTQDICQNVFLKYLLLETPFQSQEHEKAWFIRVTINACKDHLKSLFRHPAIPLELIRETAPSLPETDSSVHRLTGSAAESGGRFGPAAKTPGQPLPRKTKATPCCQQGRQLLLLPRGRRKENSFASMAEADIEP